MHGGRRIALAALAYVAAAGTAAGGAWLASGHGPGVSPARGLSAGDPRVADVPREPSDAAPWRWPAAVTAFGMGGGGALFQPAISPHDARVLFVQCDMGGVYRTTDAGASWRVLDGSQIRAVVCDDCPPAAFTFHPREASTLYAFAAHRGREALLISRDGGESFAPLVAGRAPWGDAQVTALALDPDEPERMIAGTSAGAWRSLDGGSRWSRIAMPVAVADAGAGTAAVAGASAGATAGVDDEVIGVAGHGARWFVATRSRVLRSEDRGARWEDASSGLPAGPFRRFAMSGDPEARATLWVTAPSRVVLGRLEGGVFRSGDLGRTWQSAMDGGLNRTTARVDPHGLDDVPEYAFLGAARAPDVAYVTTRGNGLWPPHDFTVWRTPDAARTWREVLLGDPRLREARGLAPNVEAGWLTWDYGWYWGGDAYGLGVDPVDAEHAIYTNLGEVLETRDGGGSWRQIYTDPVPQAAPAAGLGWRTRGIDVTSSWHVYEDPFAPTRLFVAHSDIGLTRSDDGGRSWHHSLRGSPWTNSVYALAFDPAVRGRVWAAASAQHDIPHWTQLEAGGKKKSGGVVFSEDGGVSWTSRSQGLPDLPATSLVLDPSSPPDRRTLWVAVFGAGVFRSDDGGLAWRLTSRAFGESPHVHEVVRHPGGALFAVVSGARLTRRALAPSSGVWRSDDGGATWRSITAGGAVPPFWIGGFAVDPRDPARAWVTTSDVTHETTASGESGGVYATTDSGATWRKLALPRPDDGLALELFAPALDPRDPRVLWVGSNGHGTWESDDGGATFHELALPFRATHRVERLASYENAVFVTTFGGGTWRVPRLASRGAPREDAP